MRELDNGEIEFCLEQTRKIGQLWRYFGWLEDSWNFTENSTVKPSKLRKKRAEIDNEMEIFRQKLKNIFSDREAA